MSSDISPEFDQLLDKYGSIKVLTLHYRVIWSDCVILSCWFIIDFLLQLRAGHSLLFLDLLILGIITGWSSSTSWPWQLWWGNLIFIVVGRFRGLHCGLSCHHSKSILSPRPHEIPELVRRSILSTSLSTEENGRWLIQAISKTDFPLDTTCFSARTQNHPNPHLVTLKTTTA